MGILFEMKKAEEIYDTSDRQHHLGYIHCIYLDLLKSLFHYEKSLNYSLTFLPSDDSQLAAEFIQILEFVLENKRNLMKHLVCTIILLECIFCQTISPQHFHTLKRSLIYGRNLFHFIIIHHNGCYSLPFSPYTRTFSILFRSDHKHAEQSLSIARYSFQPDHRHMQMFQDYYDELKHAILEHQQKII